MYEKELWNELIIGDIISFNSDGVDNSGHGDLEKVGEDEVQLTAL